jgi:hypothetical protein
VAKDRWMGRELMMKSGTQLIRKMGGSAGIWVDKEACELLRWDMGGLVWR